MVDGTTLSMSGHRRPANSGIWLTMRGGSRPSRTILRLLRSRAASANPPGVSSHAALTHMPPCPDLHERSLERSGVPALSVRFTWRSPSHDGGLRDGQRLPPRAGLPCCRASRTRALQAHIETVDAHVDVLTAKCAGTARLLVRKCDSRGDRQSCSELRFASIVG